MNNKAEIIKTRDEVFDKEMLRNTILNDGIQDSQRFEIWKVVANLDDFKHKQLHINKFQYD